MPSLAPITTRVAARAPGLARIAERGAWRVKNLPRTRGFDPHRAPYDPDLYEELRTRGIAVRGFDAVFGEEQRPVVAALIEHAQNPRARRQSPTKDFLTRLLPERVEVEGPFLQLALDPQLIALSNAYMGMRSYLRGLDVWLNVPTPDPPKLSQLWHRDYDDLINVKVFVYLSDVGPEQGPFTFAPRTHPRGEIAIDVAARMDDDEMARFVPREDWVVCTGPVGTVVVADTCGFHKGGKPVEGERMLWTAQYTSGAPRDARDFTVGENGTAQLSVDQRYALLEHPRRA
jgi:hypothetical protein